MDLNNFDLLALQTKYMQQDKTTIGMCSALNKQLSDIASKTDQILIYSRIDEISEDILDILSYQFHVDFYDTALPIEKKRLLVKNSLLWHKTKGTPAAVEEVITAAFDESWIEEWFQYSGNPYMFKIITTDRITDTEKISQIITAIDSVKNIRSHLEEFIFQRDNHIDKYYGGAVSISTVHTIKAEV